MTRELASQSVDGAVRPVGDVSAQSARPQITDARQVLVVDNPSRVWVRPNTNSSNRSVSGCLLCGIPENSIETSVKLLTIHSARVRTGLHSPSMLIHMFKSRKR